MKELEDLKLVSLLDDLIDEVGEDQSHHHQQNTTISMLERIDHNIERIVVYASTK